MIDHQILIYQCVFHWLGHNPIIVLNLNATEPQCWLLHKRVRLRPDTPGNIPSLEPNVNQDLGYHMLSVDHFNDVIMDAMASQITSLAIVYSTVYSGADQRKYNAANVSIWWRQLASMSSFCLTSVFTYSRNSVSLPKRPAIAYPYHKIRHCWCIRFPSQSCLVLMDHNISLMPFKA